MDSSSICGQPILLKNLHVVVFPVHLFRGSKNWKADMGEFLAHFGNSDSEDDDSGETSSMLFVDNPGRRQSTYLKQEVSDPT